MDVAVLFATLAEIAGVFVGFAALIGFTRRSETGGAQLARIRAVVTTGAQARATPVVIALFWLLELAVQLPLVLVLVGAAPAVDAALYLTAVVVHLFEAAFVLAQLVYSTGDRQPASSDPGGL